MVVLHFANDTDGKDGAWTQFLKPEEAAQIKQLLFLSQYLLIIYV
jgi:hypothetical protein